VGVCVQHFPSFWGQKDQEYMIIILLHILASDVGPRNKIKILFLFHFWKNLGWKFRELAKNKILIFFLVGHLEGRLIRAPTNKKILALCLGVNSLPQGETLKTIHIKSLLWIGPN
jgi:hypothetical protein